MNRLWPEFDKQTMDFIREAIESRRWAIAQPGGEDSFIDRVEAALARRFGKAHAVTTCNGSAAIVIALQALGIGPGDGVVCPATTWIGCATSILRVGATPIFVDAEVATPLMNFDELEDLQTPIPIRAVLAVHLYASRLNILKLRQMFPRAKIIEDSSHSFSVSEHADVTVCSLQATKILTCGEGGVAFTYDPELARNMEALRADGRIRDLEDRAAGLSPHVIQGANYAMSEVTAALLADQLDRFSQQCKRRRRGLGDAVDLEECREKELLISSVEAEAAGTFHGVPFVTADPERTISLLDPEEFGFRLSRAYPPVPEYRQFADMPLAHARAGYLSTRLENSERWYRSSVIIPHEAFLDQQPKFFEFLRSQP